MKKLFILSCCFFSSTLTFAQSESKLWKEISEDQITITGKREIVPERYKTFNLDVLKLKNLLSTAPLDKDVVVEHSSIVIDLPMPNGDIQQFKLSESPVMENELQNSFPNIRTYNVKGITDKYASGKLDFTEYGFHGMIRSPYGDVFIDPFCRENINDYISYYTSDFIKPMQERTICEGVLASIENTQNEFKPMSPMAICAGATLRTYRLAVACTGEYARAACGTGTNTPTTAQILAKVVTTVNRVDGVYETEVATKLILVNTTTLVLFGNPSTDPFNGNNNGGTLIGESQSVITATIGTANFDIGHTFSTGGGGLAGLGVVCSSSQKARGITGSPSPVGDPYDIDYVAHEMGHQFSGNHSFNGNGGSCAGNRNASTAMEPGSGVTIMAYAGICSTNDIANHSIAYFHGVSYDEITNFINSGSGNSCPVATSTGNNPPSVSAGANYTIPKSTPFQLTGSATDPDGDALTYQWEEMDAGTSAGSWNSGSKPFFMSYAPTTSPTRLFPKLASINLGTYTTTAGEYLPSTTQTLKFRLTARDNKVGGGGVCSSTATVSVNGSAGPFAVTSQSTAGISYPSGSTQTITWNVNGTDVAPINCSNVNIYISTDNSATFTLVAANTPNDGTENVVLPTIPVTKTICRVKVESVGNVFFDINKKMFTITASVTGINSMTNDIGIQLYPNPFSSTVKVDINANGKLNEAKTVINVYDILGNLVKAENIKLTEKYTNTFDFSYLSSGTYIIVVTDGNHKSVARLVKM